MRTVSQIAEAARRAQPSIAAATTETKNRVLIALASLLRTNSGQLIKENARDLTAANEAGLSAAMTDRLRLTDERIEGIAKGVLEIAELHDPVGRMLSTETRPNGLSVGRMQIPLGVIAIIFESRPNVVVDAATLCMKAGNATILKGGKEAHFSNIALAKLIAESLASEGLSTDVVQLLTERSQVHELLQQDETIDLVIPRGGEGLIHYVCQHSRIPVVRHYKGVCHVFIDESADPNMAIEIAVNAKAQRPGVCNAMETLLVHSATAHTLLPMLVAALEKAGVEIRGCEQSQQLVPSIQAATDADWDAEYLDLVLAVRIVRDMEEAIKHIEAHGSLHTEAIVTQNETNAQVFIQRVDSSAVMVNASTRFNDGGQLGLGAEIGISTSKVHAFGPMGINELTSRKFVVMGGGHIRS